MAKGRNWRHALVTELRIYFEGDRGLKSGFHKFLSEIVELARAKRCKFQLVEANGTPIEDFLTALETHHDAWNVLLLDAEGPAEAELRKGRLKACDEDSVFWMVQIMESWFLADTDALEKLFRQAPPRGNPNVEQIPKKDVLERLNKLAGGEYHKVRHGARLLELIEPSRVRKAAPNCERMFSTILGKLG